MKTCCHSASSPSRVKDAPLLPGTEQLGADTLAGEGGHDLIRDGGGDNVDGGAGDDTIAFGLGTTDATLVGGDGSDVLRLDFTGDVTWDGSSFSYAAAGGAGTVTLQTPGFEFVETNSTMAGGLVIRRIAV